ncbi:MAG: hypothetical protein K5Q68_07740 [Roseococcus sp.]|nr:hypothetical protein [Roseococcus sp.]
MTMLTRGYAWAQPTAIPSGETCSIAARYRSVPVLMTRGLFFGALDQSKLFENPSKIEAFSIRRVDEEEQGLP